MDEKIEKSLERIIEYLFWDEIRDWEARRKPRNHIYIDIRRVDRWLDKVSVRERVSEDTR